MINLLQRPDCEIAVGVESFRFSFPSKTAALNFVKSHTEAIAYIVGHWKFKEALVSYPNCDSPIPITSELFDETLVTKDYTDMLYGLVTDQWKRLISEINNESRPTFLVSMVQHKNILVNPAACEMMGCSSEELLRRDLAPLWVPPGELKPINYSVQLPPYLEEFNKLLRQQTELFNHSFSNWKPAGDNSDATWTTWNDDLRVEVIDGHPYRLMRVNGFEVATV